MSATFPQPLVADEVPDIAASAELARGYELGRRAWPEIALPHHLYAAAVAKALSGHSTSVETLAHRDLYVATAALAGIAEAIEAIATHYFQSIPLLLAQMKEHAITADEVCSRLRERLLVPRPGRAPGIGSYRGRGSLAGWLRVTAGRLILELRQREHRELYAQPDSLHTIIAASEADPELLYLKKLYRSEFKQAFERAVAALDAKQRNLLRYQVIHGLSIDRIAAIYGTHRATAARWLVKARAELTQRTRDELAAKLGLDETELESIYRLIQSQMDASLARALT